MAQHYPEGIAHERMSRSRCPECGAPPVTHSDDARFWIPRACDLTAVGVVERIDQYREDLAVSS